MMMGTMTVRATDGIPEYKGTNFVNMAMEEERVRGLCERWAVDWRDRGSVNRGDPSIEQADSEEEKGFSIEKERELWKNTEKDPKNGEE